MSFWREIKRRDNSFRRCPSSSNSKCCNRSKAKAEVPTPLVCPQAWQLLTTTARDPKAAPMIRPPAKETA